MTAITHRATTANTANNAVAQRCTQNRTISTRALTPPIELIDAPSRQLARSERSATAAGTMPSTAATLDFLGPSEHRNFVVGNGGGREEVAFVFGVEDWVFNVRAGESCDGFAGLPEA